MTSSSVAQASFHSSIRSAARLSETSSVLVTSINPRRTARATFSWLQTVEGWSSLTSVPRKISSAMGFPLLVEATRDAVGRWKYTHPRAVASRGQLGGLPQDHGFDEARTQAHDRSTFFAFSSWPAPSCPEGIITAIATRVSQAPLAETSKSTRQLAAKTGTAHALSDKNPIPATMKDK